MKNITTIVSYENTWCLCQGLRIYTGSISAQPDEMEKGTEQKMKTISLENLNPQKYFP